ncbi:MAG: HINT domain-containing protein [Bifidobacteriaceae bacterium]|nr:HINT domain-containing protein [Bifidobacteriaceae bacterium]
MVATVATAGAAGPVVGALIYGALAVDVAFQASDLVEELTGTNLIKDAVFGGNEAAYAAVSLGVGLLGGIGPDDVAKLAGKTDDVVGLASAVGSGSRKAADKADEAASAKSASGASKSDAGAQKRSGCPLGSSFAGATRVVAGDGGSAARIDSLQVGDQVLGQDAATGQTSPETVTAVWSHQSETWALSLSDGQRVETTANHPWYTANRDAWVRTDHLRAGDQLRTAAGAATTVKDVSPTGQTATVWNLTATGAHTYHVTTTNPQAAILVHNADPGELVNPNSCPLTAPGSGTRPPPNPYGKKGGPAHQDEVARVAQDIDARGLGVKTEYRIMTPGGQKGSRWVDVVGIDKQTGQVAELHQVGKQTVRSQVPVARERAAIADIQTRGVATKYIDPGTLKVVFHPYNKP